MKGEGVQVVEEISSDETPEPQRPSIGRIVHFVLPNGEHRPAVIVKIWSSADAGIQLQVFTDGLNDSLNNVEWRTSVRQDKNQRPETWHWPERD